MLGHRQADEATGVSAETLGIGGLFDHLRDGVVVADDSGRIVLWNPAATSIFGYPADEAIGQNVEMLVPLELRSQHRSGLAHWRETGAGRYIDSRRPLELPARGRDGSALQVELTLSPLRNGDTQRYVMAVVRDATARKALEAELVHHSLRDEVTGLPNRTLFLDTVRRGLQHARWRKHGLAVLLVDLTRFAELRASLGQEAADSLLAQVGERLTQAMRAEDLVARLEADVFGVVLHSLGSEATAGEAADRLLALLQTPFRIGSQRIVLSASIGLAISATPRQPADELLRDAELAVLEAKRDGPGAWHRYDRSIPVPVPPESLDLVSDLRLAIERGEFVVHYQPIVRMVDGSVYGVEALVRWQHPSRRLLHAAEFVPLAERHGLIGQIDAWVLHEACRQGAAWQRAHPSERPLTIAVNVSPSDLRQASLTDHLGSVLTECHLSADSLLLEITETSALVEPARVAQVLDAVRGMGVRLALDDFGAGSHALSHLRHLPLDALKLDRGFVGSLAEPRSAAIVTAVVALAHELGMDVVAEGVESTDQARTLGELGCDLAQGYLFAPALPATEVAALLEKTGPMVETAAIAR